MFQFNTILRNCLKCPIQDTALERLVSASAHLCSSRPRPVMDTILYVGIPA